MEAVSMKFNGYFELFKIPGLGYYLLARFFAYVSRQMYMLIVSWQVYQLTHDPLALAYIGLAGSLPYLAVSLWVGHYVDTKERKRIQFFSLGARILCLLGLMLVSHRGSGSIALIYLLIGVTGFFNSFETVSASAYFQTLVPKPMYPRAVAWFASLYQSSIVIGPLLAGFLLSKFSPACTYAITSGIAGLGLWCITKLNKQIPASPLNNESAISSILEGIKFIRSKKILLASMSLDMLGVLFGDVIGILPIFADMLGLGSVGLGFLRASPAIGAILMAQFNTYFPLKQIKWDYLLASVFVFGCCIFCFAFSKNFILSVSLLALGGMADNIGVIIRHSIYQAATPDHLRGRVSSINSIFLRSADEIGTFESGLAAKLMGTVPSVVFGSLMTMAVCVVMKWKYWSLDRE